MTTCIYLMLLSIWVKQWSGSLLDYVALIGIIINLANDLLNVYEGNEEENEMPH